MQAVILAGGLGTRLRPITDKMPKHIVRVGNKPFLEHIINLLKQNAINDIVLCVGYLWEQIKDYFKDGKKFGVDIRYSVEKELMGTGGALKLSERYLEDDFLLLYGDSYLDIDLRKLMELHKEINKKCTMVVYDNKSKTFVRNNVEIDNKGYVVNYNKKTQDEKMDYVDAGVLTFKKSILNFIPQNKKVSLEEDVFPKLIKMKELYSFKSKNRFYDIGTMQRLKVFEKVFK